MSEEKPLTLADYRLAQRQPFYLRFDKQHAVKADPSSLRALFCSRRAGKTEELVFETVEALADIQECYVVFIGLSAKSARSIFHRKAQNMNMRYCWGLKFSSSTLAFTYPKTKSTCLIFGSDNIADIEKTLGLSRVAFLICDECGAWRQDTLKDTVESIVGPALEDLGGKTILAGTPGREHFGYWYELTHGRVPGYSIHKWNLTDNPFMPKGVLESVKKKYHWTDDTPAFRQQYLGEWCLDTTTLVFSDFRDDRIQRLEKDSGSGVIRVLSADFGSVHATALTILEQRSDKTIHVPYSEPRTGLAPSQVADWILGLYRRWNCVEVVGDLGGLGKGYAEEMKLRYGIDIIPADKRDKLALIALTNDEFRQKTLTVAPECDELIRQIRKVQWNEDHSDLAEGQIDDSAESLLYGVQHVRKRGISRDRYSAAFSQIGL